MLRFFALLLPVALLLLPPAAAQTPSQVPEKTVTFTIINGDLLTTLVRLERQYHIQCVLRDGIDAQSKINVNLSSVPLSLTLRVLASSANALVTQTSDGVYMFTPKPMVASAEPDYFLPPTHLIGSFGSGSFGTGGFGTTAFSGSSQPYPQVVFPHTLPVPLSDMLDGRDPEHTQPGGVRRVFAVGQSF